ncbi:MAG: Peptidylprolyl isomerase [Bacteroidetes bacterium]|nr:Peptidylprolyl isomerase [Bacteroidota bacterium]
MAVIGEIRKRPGLLVGIIALSIVLFLLGVAVNDQFSVLRPGHGTDAASVDGQSISYSEFSTEVSDNIKNIETQRRISLNDVMRNGVNKQTWDDMINKILMDQASQKTGVVVSDDELVSLTMTENLHPIIRQQFFGNGPVDVVGLNGWIKNINVDEKGQEPGFKRKIWNNLNKEVKKSQLQAKYSMLVLKSVGNVPKWLAEEIYVENSKTADFRYVALPYNEVNDNDIKYTDADLKEYLNKNAAKFTSTEETRRIQYLAFDVVPSSADSAATLKGLTDKLDEFTKGATKSDDSLFVKLSSETPMVDLYTLKDPALGSPKLADSLFELPLKTVIGPYVENGMYKFAKISARKMLSDSVKVKEIIYSFANVQNEADQKAKFVLIDSVLKAVDSMHTDFSTAAAAFSDDPQAKTTGGLVGWVKLSDPSRDETYKGIVFHNAEIGKAYKYLDIQNNLIKLVQVVEDKPSKLGIKMAYLTRSLAPSQETERDIYGEVTQFASNNSTEAKFKKYAADHAAQVKTASSITKESYDINQLSARALVKWVFEAKRGDVSSIKTLDDGSGVNGRKYVIAYLESVTGEGTPDLESVKDQVKLQYLREKKYELLAKKITDAKAANIDDLATKLGKTAEEADRSIFANPNIPAGMEPAVVAAGVYIAQGKVSAPIKGNKGVYAVQKITGTDPPAATDLTRPVMMAQQEAMGKIRNGDIQKALRDLSKVRDNRFNFETN